MRGPRWLAISVVLVAVASGGARVDAASIDASRVEDELLQASSPVQVIARFDASVPDALLALDGLAIDYRFQALPAVVATATPSAVRALAALDSLAYLEVPKPIHFDLDSATVASRAIEVTGGDDPVLDGDGAVVDGSGIGIAIVDSGLDALHPDLDDPGKVGGNWLVTAAGLVSSPYVPDTATGHGTHVAGIAAGTGEVSGGLFRGVAPGATLYGFGVTVNGSTANAAMAFDWILANGAAQDPPIRIVNNSWNCGSAVCQALHPEQIHVHAASALAEAGMVVTWSAGNESGDGIRPTINPEATNPTPGIIGVANYKDQGWSDLPTGTRAGCLSSSSSWGASADPTTWPDVSAPGRSVTSTWAMGPYFRHSLSAGEFQLTGRNPATGDYSYISMSGTSMAAPHTAGVAALLLQANPDLSPAEVEYLLKDTAEPLVGTPEKSGCGVPGTDPPETITYINADPAHAWNGSNYAAGHGLIDAVDAVAAAAAFSGIPGDMPAPTDPADVAGFIVANPAADYVHDLYLTGQDALSAEPPQGVVPTVRPVAPGSTVTHTSGPLDEDLTFEAARVSLSYGTNAECPCSRLTPPFVRARLSRIDANGDEHDIGESLSGTWFVNPVAPIPRALDLRLASPVTVAAGERVRLAIEWVTPALQAVNPGPYLMMMYTEGSTSARVSFGDVVPNAASTSRATCDAVQWCAEIGGERTYEGMTCGRGVVRLRWQGPPGSALRFSCYELEFTCAIVGEPGQTADGECEQVVEVTTARAYRGAICTYIMPDGSRGGSGRCEHLTAVESGD